MNDETHRERLRMDLERKIERKIEKKIGMAPPNPHTHRHTNLLIIINEAEKATVLPAWNRLRAREKRRWRERKRGK